MNAPQWFVRALSTLDPLLRVRWGNVRAHWVIERKGIIPAQELEILIRRERRLWRWITTPAPAQQDAIHKNRITWMNVAEELDSARRGYRVICMPTVLNNQVYHDLCRSDFQRYGGFARFCDELEAQETFAENDAERQLTNKRQAMNGEVYDIMQFLNRKRGSAMEAGRTDLNYLLHGKQSPEGDKPLLTLAEF